MTTQTYQQASQRFLAQAKHRTGRRRSPAGIREGLGGYRPNTQGHRRTATPAGNTADTGITIESSADSGQKPVTATLPNLFAVASVLHENFYEDQMEAHDVAHALVDVEVLMDKLKNTFTEPDVVSATLTRQSSEIASLN